MEEYYMTDDGDLYCAFTEPRIYPEMLEPGHVLKLKRTHDNYNLSQLAERLGVSIATLSKYENGKCDIPKGREKTFHSYLHLEWHMDGEIIDLIEEVGDE